MPKKLEYLTKKFRTFKKIDILKVRYPGRLNCIKKDFYIIYSGNFISCSKRELTEY